jgi:sugar O-acyltransferase (sialic acid O-acetyltransferase NeuD family)
VKRLAILGASGHGKVVADIAGQMGDWDEIVFFDDFKPVGCVVSGLWDVLGDASDMALRVNDFDGVIIGIGDNCVRLDMTIRMLKSGARLVSVVHPRACVSPLAKVAVGSVVMAGAVVSSDASIGMANIINTGSTVDHDCLLSDGVHISPGANLAGCVTIGACSWIGIGSSVKQQVSIGCNVIVGAGSVVVNDVPDDVTVIGCPACVLCE